MPTNQAFRYSKQSWQGSLLATVRQAGERVLAFFRLSTASRWLAAFAGGLAVLTAVGAFVALRQPPFEHAKEEVIQELEGLKSQLAMLGADLDDLKKQEQTPSPGTDKSQVAVRLGRLEGALTELQSHQTKLEEIVLNNPARVLELHSLRSELDELKESQHQDRLAIGHGMERLYTLSKWLFGVMALSIAALASGYWVRESREADTEQNPEGEIADLYSTDNLSSTLRNDDHN